MEWNLKDGSLWLKVKGEFDMSKCPALREIAFTQIEEQGVHRIVFDCSSITFIDSSGLGLMLTLYKKTAPMGGGVFVKNVNPLLMPFFVMAGLDKILEIQEEKG
ncbi:MAG: STAS domain-containing protein, partial [Bacillota bacterium]|nr:STAS domain-containing protein [Bacillota bacterium]